MPRHFKVPTWHIRRAANAAPVPQLELTDSELRSLTQDQLNRLLRQLLNTYRNNIVNSMGDEFGC